MNTPEEVAAIEDLRERLEAATTLVADALRGKKESLALRDMAMIVAHLDRGVAPVVLWRDTLGRSRALFNRILGRAPSDRERKAIVAANPEAFEDPVATTAQAAADAKRYEATLKEARKIRDRTARSLMSGRGDNGERFPPEPNAYVHRVTGLTTARVSQVRAGK